MLENYNDILEVKQICEILKINRGTAYKLLNSGVIPYRRIGKGYKIPKEMLIRYLIGDINMTNDTGTEYSRKEKYMKEIKETEINSEKLEEEKYV